MRVLLHAQLKNFTRKANNAAHRPAAMAPEGNGGFMIGKSCAGCSPRPRRFFLLAGSDGNAQAQPRAAQQGRDPGERCRSGQRNPRSNNARNSRRISVRQTSTRNRGLRHGIGMLKPTRRSPTRRRGQAAGVEGHRLRKHDEGTKARAQRHAGSIASVTRGGVEIMQAPAAGLVLSEP